MIGLGHWLRQANRKAWPDTDHNEPSQPVVAQEGQNGTLSGQQWEYIHGSAKFFCLQGVERACRG